MDYKEHLKREYPELAEALECLGQQIESLELVSIDDLERLYNLEPLKRRSH